MTNQYASSTSTDQLALNRVFTLLIMSCWGVAGLAVLLGLFLKLDLSSSVLTPAQVRFVALCCTTAMFTGIGLAVPILSSLLGSLFKVSGKYDYAWSLFGAGLSILVVDAILINNSGLFFTYLLGGVLGYLAVVFFHAWISIEDRALRAEAAAGNLTENVFLSVPVR